MKPTNRRRHERGVTILEVVIAATVMLIAMVVFLTVAVVAANSTRFAHRTTSLAMLRSALIDSLTVTPRTSFQATAGWVVDRCWDSNSQLVAANGAPLSSTFACPASAIYRSWRNVTANGAASWSVGIYVERTDGGCTSNTRYQSIGCVAADLLLTD